MSMTPEDPQRPNQPNAAEAETNESPNHQPTAPQQTTPIPEAFGGGTATHVAASGDAQPTAPLPSAAINYPAPHAPYQAPQQAQASPQATQGGQPPLPSQTATTKAAKGQHQKSRAGVLVAGLAIGALLGGVAGGGVAAVIAANSSAQSVVQGSGELTLTNSQTATEISGIAAVATPSVVTLQVAAGSTGGSGSGVIVSEDGYIVTNAHVVTLDGEASNAEIMVQMSDGTLMQAELVGTDPYADLAVVKVKAEGLPAIKFADSNNINVGDLAVAIGAPMNLANTVTSGVVSAVFRGISVGSPLIPDDQSDDQNGDGGTPWDFRFDSPDSDGEGEQQQQQQQAAGGSVTIPVIQTDASINPGNSGGALLNGKGELIGVNVAIASPTSTEGVAGSDGLGFAIPSNLVNRVVDSLIAGEQPSHGLLGATISDSLKASQEGTSRAGGQIAEVSPGGAADKAGLRSGDIITSIDGVPAGDGTTVSALVRMHDAGSKVELTYVRNGREETTEVTLGTLE